LNERAAAVMAEHKQDQAKIKNGVATPIENWSCPKPESQLQPYSNRSTKSGCRIAADAADAAACRRPARSSWTRDADRCPPLLLLLLLS
jgi:hypothetical protein